ncbi:MAG: rnmV [Clostridiales bacterium]|nr:rnmV [Clostridiales bacterium]
MIKEIIVVEGKDDIIAVKRAVDAELIATSGLGLNDRIMERIKSAAQRRGIIVFTDPDYPGEKIRKMIQSEVPNCKHAFLPRELATKDGDVGIENATPESIREALLKVKTEVDSNRFEFNINDLVKYNLTGTNMSVKRRDFMGRELGIGYGNTKQFLNRLNRYGILREEFNVAAEKMNGVIK